MTFAREVLDSKEFQSVVDSLKDLIDEDGALTSKEWRDEDTRVLYELGFNLYRTKEFVHAESIFRKLVVMKPLDKNHWQGLASSIQMQKRYHDALTPWSMYAFIDPKCPIPHFHAAECLLAIKDYTDCLKAIEALFERDTLGAYQDKADSMKQVCLTHLEEQHGSS